MHCSWLCASLETKEQRPVNMLSPITQPRQQASNHVLQVCQTCQSLINVVFDCHYNMLGHVTVQNFEAWAKICEECEGQCCASRSWCQLPTQVSSGSLCLSEQPGLNEVVPSSFYFFWYQSHSNAGKLFGENCTVLPGLLSIAFGPCQEVQGAISVQAPSASFAETQQQNTVLGWLNSLGLQTIEEVACALLHSSCLLFIALAFRG